MDAANAPEWLLSIAMAAGTAVAAFTAYKRGGGEKTVSGTEAATQIVAATFTERAQLDRLIGALGTLNETLSDTNDCTGELAGLMRVEAQRRHDEQVIRDALRARGIME